MHPRLLLLSLLLGLSSTSLMAAEGAVELPIDLVANHGEYDANAGIATYTGDVVVTQGEMRLTGDKVVLHTEEGEVIKIESWGKLATFHYVPQEDPPIDGKGGYMRYTVQNALIYIEGNAYVKQEKNETYGDTLTYDLNKEFITGERVQMSFTPKTK
ncbi:lipopolysaccharide transport periplasmic protein LptA [Suttonella sp. R2A3]|uniref:lipopolysaccharide transport periplasmic protein LptA n=1 Tax=Suttonella sp. R2A3 TaxID=2908648 RepID=UPI001F4677D1|nr:lipopolysaccharide transport periplasmic protein LptA [Suttonella sp. R2A3]UJF24599.1 lipopolysaccharide transport periplasmic protein LptA [Suttonella sp. R2A3]